MTDFLESLSIAIVYLESFQDLDRDDLTDQEREYLALLKFCFDLFARTDENLNTKITIPELENTPEESNVFNPLGLAHNPFADFVFNILAKKNSVNLRELMHKFISTQHQTAANAKTTQATISNYLNNKSSISADLYNSIINAYINNHKKPEPCQ